MHRDAARVYLKLLPLTASRAIVSRPPRSKRASEWTTLVRSVTTAWHVGITPEWLDGMFREVVLGWQSFSNAPANDVWMDDVVLSQEPIGCD